MEIKLRFQQDFKYHGVPDENVVQKGLVIKNAETSNQYVWIEVPKTIYKTATSNNDYENIEEDMKNYAKIYTDDNCTDTWYNGCGITSELEYQDLKNKMLASVYEKGGFWIGQCEAGINQPKTNGLEVESIDTIVSTNGLPLSQVQKYPYNFVTCSQAQQLANKLGEGKEYHTSLMFGIQWDLMCKFIEGMKDKNEILEDSTSWGNYQNATFEMVRGNYTENPSLANLWKIASETGSYLKPAVAVLCTTGATNRNQAYNVYDLAGNVSEWTLEKSVDNMPVSRGGHWESEENQNKLIMRNYDTGENSNIGFRITIY